MQVDLRLKNIVLVGAFDVNVFDKYFFIKNDIISENEILSTSIFANSQGVVQLFTNDFHLIIVAGQLVLSSLKPQDENDNKLNKIAPSIITEGKIGNSTGLGINFHWYLTDKTKSLEQLSRDYFFTDKIDLFSKQFNNSNSLFGVYASTTIKDARLKLDVKPSKLEATNTTSYEDVINFAFNFHFDVINNKDKYDPLKYLADYDFYKNESKRIISTYK